MASRQLAAAHFSVARLGQQIMASAQGKSYLRRPATAGARRVPSRASARLTPTGRSSASQFQRSSSPLSGLLTVEGVSQRCRRMQSMILQDPHTIEGVVLDRFLGECEPVVLNLPLAPGKFANELLQSFTFGSVPRRRRLRKKPRKKAALSITKIPPFTPTIALREKLNCSRTPIKPVI